MIGEERAEEYVRAIHHDVNSWGGVEPDERFYNEIKFKQAWLDGFAEGKPKWHNLRNNPDDLPKECENVLLCLCGVGVRHYSVGCFIKTNNDLSWWSNIVSKELYNVIAWCELPKFEEE